MTNETQLDYRDFLYDEPDPVPDEERLNSILPANEIIAVPGPFVSDERDVANGRQCEDFALILCVLDRFTGEPVMSVNSGLYFHLFISCETPAPGVYQGLRSPKLDRNKIFGLNESQLASVVVQIYQDRDSWVPSYMQDVPPGLFG